MNKTAIITGGARGIGAQTTRVLAQSGCKVLINYHRSKAEADKLAGELCASGFDAGVFCADVTVRSEVDAMTAFCAETFGTPDILVNNAGIAQSALFTDITYADWQKMLDVNLTGVFHCCQSALKFMLPKKSGKIINISSVWGMVGASCEVHYSAAKAGVIGLTKALAKELAPSGIQVNCVAPGVVETDMLSGFSPEELACLKKETPVGRLGNPSDVARCVLFLSSGGSDFITGQVISPNGGFVI